MCDGIKTCKPQIFVLEFGHYEFKENFSHFVKYHILVLYRRDCRVGGVGADIWK